MLSSAALDAAIEALPEEGALLPLQLSPAVAALQCAISTEMRIRVGECVPTTVCHCSVPAEASSRRTTLCRVTTA
jgi:hypothetical protein